MELAKFFIIGIYILTTNQNGQSSQDIPALWQRFFSENIIEKIPNKLDGSFYSVYTQYEGDYMQPYTAILGCKVSSLENIPEGMIGIEIPSGRYQKFVAKGDLTLGAVFREWLKIWDTPLERSYRADFEVYGEKASNPRQAEVDIYVGVE